VFIGAGLRETLNTDIQAETGLNTEAAIAWEPGPFNLGATLFETRIEQFIYDQAPHPSPDIRGWRDNVGDMEISGLEAWAGYELGPLALLLTVADVDSRLSASSAYAQPPTDSPSNLDGARLPETQGLTWSFSADYTFAAPQLKLNWETMQVASLDGDKVLGGPDLSSSKTGFVVHNISALWTPEDTLEGLTVALGVDNLFDEYYVSQSSNSGLTFHPLFGALDLRDFEPGRNVKATVAWQF